MIPVLITLSILLALFIAFRFFLFLRNPERCVLVDETMILSPADGFVIYIVRVVPGQEVFSVKNGVPIRLDELMSTKDQSLDGSPGWLIGIYMTPLDVHYNRSPIRGRIHKISHRFPEASSGNESMFNGQANLLFGVRPQWKDCGYLVSNERASYAFTNATRSVFVTQIADRWVRRIVTLRDDGNIDQGEVFGLIRMGSQVDLFVPGDHDTMKVLVKERQHVRAGLTALIRV